MNLLETKDIGSFGMIELVNELTAVFDKYMDFYCRIESYKVYMIPSNDKVRHPNTYMLRYPGTTIGSIEYDENHIIQKININKRELEYMFDGSKALVKEANEFIGYQIVIK